MNYLESVMHLNNVVNEKFINKLIPFIDHKAKHNLRVEGGLVKDIRNVKGYHLNFDNPSNMFYWNFIKNEIERLYFLYKSKFPQMNSTKINQIDLLKYNPGGNYKIHTDHYTTVARHLSIIINLNDNYKGGDLVFFDQKEKETMRLKLSKGSIVFFPSNFMYPHSIQPITKGTRYSIVAWLQ